jgi:hypothetical protein
MRSLPILLFVGINACAAFARDSKAYVICGSSAKTQAEINECQSRTRG